MQENKTFIKKSCKEKTIPKHKKQKWEDNIKMDPSKTACQLPKKLYNDY
jgi:hypothetical protein